MSYTDDKVMYTPIKSSGLNSYCANLLYLTCVSTIYTKSAN